MKLKKLLAAVTAAALAVTTVAVTSFTASAATPEFSEKWSGSGVTATYTASAKPDPLPDGADEWNDNDTPKDSETGYPFNHEIDISSLITEGKTYADVRSVTFAFSATGGNAGGGVGINILADGSPAWGNWTSGSYELPTQNSVTIDTPMGLADNTKANANVNWINYGTVLTVNVSVTFAADEGSDEGEFEITVNPSEMTIAVGEDLTVTVLVTGTTPELQNVDGSMQATYEDTFVSVDDGTDTDDGMVYTITGVAAGTTTVDFEWTPAESTGIELETPLIVSCDVTVTDGSTPAIPDGNKITVPKNDWGAGWNWQATESIIIDGITNWTTTAPEAKEKLDSVTFSFTVNGALSDGTEFDVSKLGFQGLIQTNDASGGLWKTYNATVTGKNVKVTMDDIGTALGDKTGAVNIALIINTDAANSTQPIDVYISDITVNVKAPETDPPTPPDTGDALWEGNTDMGTDWSANVQIAANKFADIKAGDTLKFTFTKGDAEYFQLKIASAGTGWPVLSSPETNAYDSVDLTDSPYSFVINAADVAALKADGMAINGYGVILTKVELVPKDEPTPPVTGDALWEGTQDLGNWADTPVEIAAEKFTSINAKDTIKFTYTINAVPGEAWNQIKIADSNDTVLASPSGKNEWDCVDLSSTTTYSFEISAADLALVKANGMKITGHGVVLKKVECVAAGGNTPTPPEHTHTPATAWSSDATGHWHACSGCDEKLSFAAHTSDTGTVTTPATATTAGTRTYKCTVCGYVIRTESIPATGSPDEPQYPSHSTGNDSVVIPIGGINNSSVPSVNGKNGWEAVSSEILASSDGDKIIVDMNSATKVPSTIIGDIEGKDVDVVFNMGRGITWTVNGLSVTSRKTIDFDITKNTRHIPDEIVDKAEGSHKRQISLDHKGIFGCTAALSYDIGTKYNGLYANLFYYNPKTEQLEFADCSLISGGKAKFMFTHASDYLITISDEPLGEFEDVSSAAGIASDNSVIENGAVLGSVLAVIVLGFGIVVYRKRRHN